MSTWVLCPFVCVCLCVCVCVCVCVSVCVCVCVYVHYRSGTYRGGTRLVTCDLCIYYTLYCVCVITSRRNQGAATEADTIREQQLKCKADTIVEQQLKQMQSGSKITLSYTF